MSLPRRTILANRAFLAGIVIAGLACSARQDAAGLSVSALDSGLPAVEPSDVDQDLVMDEVDAGDTQEVSAPSDELVVTCPRTPQSSSLNVLVGLNCLPESFDARAELARLDINQSTGMLNSARFDFDSIEEDVACGAAPSLTFAGTPVPGLSQGMNYRLQGWFNQDNYAAVALRDLQDVILAVWFWQEKDLLTQVPVFSELGLVLSGEPQCEATHPCLAREVYNSLSIQNQDEAVLLAIGDEFAFEAGGYSYTLGHNGGSLREGPITPTCFDVRVGDDVVFALVRN